MQITKFYCDICGTESKSVGKVRLDKYKDSTREYTKEFNDLCETCYDRLYNFLDDIYTIIKDSPYVTIFPDENGGKVIRIMPSKKCLEQNQD